MLGYNPALQFGERTGSLSAFRQSFVVDVCSGTGTVGEVCAKYGKYNVSPGCLCMPSYVIGVY